MFIVEVTKTLHKAKVEFAVIGGYAVALHGALRGTIDIDLVLKLEKENFKKAETALKNIGLQSRLPISAIEVFDFRDEYIKKRNLVAWSFINPKNPTEIVDLIITESFKKSDVVAIVLGGESVPVLGLEALIKMKEKAGRPQDLLDVAALREIKRGKHK